MQLAKRKLNKRGVSGVDIAVAILIISLSLSIIVSLLIIINRTSNKVNREIEAIQLAKNVLEKIKLMHYDDFLNLIQESSNAEYSLILGIDIPESYILNIEEDTKTSTSMEEAILFSIRTEGNVRVKYMLFNEMIEVKLPYVKYFDRVYPVNRPDLNSKLIDEGEGVKELIGSEPFEPIDSKTFEPINPDEFDNWYNYGERKLSNDRKYARKKNTQGVYDIFYWEPRHIVVNNIEIFLIGKTMYALEFDYTNVEYPVGVTSHLIITKLIEQIGTPSSFDEEGVWILN